MTADRKVSNERPVVAITLGDPCGVGPEVVAKALATPGLLDRCAPLVIGDQRTLRGAMKLVGASFTLEAVAGPEGAAGQPGVVSIFDPGDLDPAAVTPGRVSREAGRASMDWVERAARLCLSGDVAAMATAPVNKEAATLAGYKEIGHTEVLQRIAGASRVPTMLMTRGLRVVHLTTHRSVRLACDAVTKENILAVLLLTDEAFRGWGFESPRIGVAALNPHGSDGGLLGDEEATQIAPGLEEARRQGVLATGPVPADIVFHQAIQGRYDAVLAMFHDQGHIPIKVHGFDESISINIGLPFIRTSVDHGTAFDIAGQGIAEATSMVRAALVAADLASGRGFDAPAAA